MSLREDAKLIYNRSISKINPSEVVYKHLEENQSILSNTTNLYLVAFGKASVAMMSGCLDYIHNKNLASSIYKRPIVVTSIPNSKTSYSVDMHLSSHPTPTELSISAGTKIMDYLKSSTKDDTVIFLVSGGGSSLLAMPPEEIPLHDKIHLTNLMLKSGLSINEINTIRKHMSLLKGGRLANIAMPSICHSLIISDVIDDNLSTIASGPTVPDYSSFQDAYEILGSYNLISSTPSSILDYINRGIKGLIDESPDKIENCTNTIICSNKLFRKEISLSAEHLGYSSLILDEDLIGFAREEGQNLITHINKVAKKNNHKLAIISGGETVVNLKGLGKGGRNQELAASFLANSDMLRYDGNWVFLSVGTDGIDGPTDAAGGIIDSHSQFMLAKNNININDFLDNNDSYNLLNNIDSLFITGESGTNVADIQITLMED